MTPEEFTNHPEVRRTRILTYWRGRLHGQLWPGIVKMDDYVAEAMKLDPLHGSLEDLYKRMLADKDAEKAT